MAGGATVRGVRQLHITLELVPGSEPIRGTVCSDTATRSFTGWMELISALQAVIEEDDPHPNGSGCGADMGTYINE